MTRSELKAPYDDLRRYSAELAARKVEDDPVLRRLQTAKRVVWMLLLAATFLVYYLFDKLNEALTMLR